MKTDETCAGPAAPDLTQMSATQFNAAIQAGIDDMLAGNVITSEQLTMNLRERFRDLWEE